MRVGDIASHDVASCGPSDSLATAARVMWERDCGCVPVMQDGQLVGIITDRDIAMAGMFQDVRLSEAPVSRSMASPVQICREGDSLADALAQMTRFQVRRLVVLDATGGVRGIVSLGDIARHVMCPLAAEPVDLDARGVAAALSRITTPRGTVEPRVRAYTPSGTWVQDAVAASPVTSA